MDAQELQYLIRFHRIESILIVVVWILVLLQTCA